MSEFAGSGAAAPESSVVNNGALPTRADVGQQLADRLYRDFGPKVDLPRLQQWLEQAQPNARLIYFTGETAGHGIEAVNERLHAEERRGMIFLVQQRRGPTQTGFDYVAVRSSRPATARPPRPPAGLHEQAEALFKRGGRA